MRPSSAIAQLTIAVLACASGAAAVDMSPRLVYPQAVVRFEE